MSIGNDVVLEKKAEIITGFAQPYRLAIIEALSQAGEVGKSVTDLVNEIGGEQANISRHLSIMKNAEILSCRKEGYYIYYSIRHENVVKIYEALNEIFYDMVQEHNKLADSLKNKSAEKQDNI